MPNHGGSTAVESASAPCQLSDAAENPGVVITVPKCFQDRINLAASSVANTGVVLGSSWRVAWWQWSVISCETTTASMKDRSPGSSMPCTLASASFNSSKEPMLGSITCHCVENHDATSD